MDVKPLADFDHFMGRYHLIVKADHAIRVTNMWADHLAYLQHSKSVLSYLFTILLGTWVYQVMTEQTVAVIASSCGLCLFLVFFRQNADYTAWAKAERIEALDKWIEARYEVSYERPDDE